MPIKYIRKITIDYREKLRGSNAKIYYSNDYDAKIESLPYGDYLFETMNDEKIIFEYKTCEDYINSIVDKSLFQEISNQSSKYKYSYLIVCGNFEQEYEDLYFKIPKLRYMYKTPQLFEKRVSKQVEGAMNRLYAMCVPIIFVEEEADAFEKMVQISIKIADSKKYGGVVRPVKKNLIENPCATFLTTIPGVGRKIGERFTSAYNIVCLDDLCKLSFDEIAGINGVTEKKARLIWEKLHDEVIVDEYEMD